MSSPGSHSDAPSLDPDVRVSGAEPTSPVALVVAHPGHELFAFGWLLRLRPEVFVVTDGSGRDAAPRIEATGRLLETGLGTRASVFGRWTDRDLYEALVEGSFEPFLGLRDELVEAWCREGTRTVICDAYERCYLMHDVVQVIVSSAVAETQRRGREIVWLEMPIYLGPRDERPGNPVPAASLTLTDELLERKIDAARTYDSAVVRDEAEVFLRERGAEGFRTEQLLQAIHRSPSGFREEPKPSWETHGEQIQEQGVYDRVIRLHQHFVPLASALDLAGPRKPVTD